MVKLKTKLKVSLKKIYVGTVDVKYTIKNKNNKSYEKMVRLSFDKVIKKEDIEKEAKKRLPIMGMN